MTFLKSGVVGLHGHGMGQGDAYDLRARLATFADEWASPEMGVYDDYDAAIAERSAR